MSAEIIYSYISKRINFLMNHIGDVFTEMTDDDMSKVKAALASSLMAVLQYINSPIVRKLAYQDLYYWHNHGLRSISVHVFNLMEMYLVKHDKEMQPRLALAFAADDKRFHTSFYRHVILNFKDIDTPRPKTVVWYGDKLDNYSSRPEMALYHLPLRILQMVFVMQEMDRGKMAKPPPTLGSIRKIFSKFSVSADKINYTLGTLCERRGYDPNGLLFVDYPARDAGFASIPDDVSVSLLPSGFYYMTRLRFMVEFLFWSFFYIDTSVFSLGEPSDAELYDNSFKTLMVTRFVADKLCPIALQEARLWRLLRINDDEIYEMCRNTFTMEGHERKLSFIGKLYKNIDVYCRVMGLDYGNGIGVNLVRIKECDKEICSLLPKGRRVVT